MSNDEMATVHVIERRRWGRKPWRVFWYNSAGCEAAHNAATAIDAWNFVQRYARQRTEEPTFVGPGGYQITWVAITKVGKADIAALTSDVRMVTVEQS